MSERWARAILTTYRWVGAAAFPMIGGYIVWRAGKGKETASAGTSATDAPAIRARTAH